MTRTEQAAFRRLEKRHEALRTALRIIDTWLTSPWCATGPENMCNRISANVTTSAGRSDAITATASPRPWSLFVNEEQEGGDGEISICAENEWIATMNLRRITAESDAALIVDAVNQYEWANEEIHRLLVEKDDMFEEAVRIRDERDRLRDIVRRALPFIEGAIDGVSTILGGAEMLQAAGEAPLKDLLEEFIADGRRVLREARAAIGEGAANG